LSLNKCFEKIENPTVNGGSRKGCLWGLNPAKADKMDEEIAKWIKRASKSTGALNGGTKEFVGWSVDDNCQFDHRMSFELTAHMSSA